MDSKFKLNFEEEKDADLLQNYREKQSKEESVYQTIATKTSSLKPYKRPLKSNSSTEQNFNLKSKHNQAQFISNQYILKTNYIIATRHSSLISDLTQLKPINLNEMFVNKIHIGFYLETNVISKPFYSSGLHLLVQDMQENYEEIVLYNFGSKYYDISPELIIPIGTKLIIKEPHLQLFSLDENDFGIRIDSPSDIIIDYPKINITSEEDLLNEANKYVSESDYYTAIRYYSHLIEKFNNLNAYLSRSQAYIHLEKFYSAYMDAKKAVELDDKNEQAHYLLGKTAYLIRQFDLALKSFQQCLTLNSTNIQFQIELDKTNQRLAESKTGRYDFHYLYEEFFKKENLFMDIADYTSDLIELSDIKNKSKGIIARETIKKGTLLVVSKAIVQQFYTHKDYRIRMHNVIDFNSNGFRARNETENIFHLAYKMQDNPILAESVYSLFGGHQFGRSKLQHPLIDIKRIEGIYDYNSFQNLNSFDTIQSVELNRQARKISHYNEYDFGDVDYDAVDFKSDSFKELARLQKEYNKYDKQCGLWLVPSYFNHACYSNCIMDFIGDILIIYSLRDVKKGDELTIRYFPPELTYTQRQEHAKNGFDFKCHCKLCKLDEKDLNRAKREAILFGLISKSVIQMSTNQLLSEVQKVRQSYGNRSELQLQMIGALETLAKKYRKTNDFKKSIKFWEELFELTKDCNDFIAVGVLKEAYNDYKKCGQNKKADGCKNKAKEYFLDIYRQSPCFEELWKRIVFKGFNYAFE